MHDNSESYTLRSRAWGDHVKSSSILEFNIEDIGDLPSLLISTPSNSPRSFLFFGLPFFWLAAAASAAARWSCLAFNFLACSACLSFSFCSASSSAYCSCSVRIAALQRSDRFSAPSPRLLSCEIMSWNCFVSRLVVLFSSLSRMSEYTDGVLTSSLEVSSSRNGVMAGPETAGAEMTEEGVVLRLRDRRPSRAFPPLLFAPAYGGILLMKRTSACRPGLQGNLGRGHWRM